VEPDVTIMDSLPYRIFLGKDIWPELGHLLTDFLSDGGVYLLVDDNTFRYCLPVVEKNLYSLQEIPAYSISPGEQSKNIATLQNVWKWLLDSGARRNSLLVNLGGGVVSDLGGFAAATYKRGIHFINIPTSLIGLVDAAIGGKTGINFSGIKNQAGLFYDPDAVFVYSGFLDTLPKSHIRSGLAEIIKAALLSGNDFWDKIKKANLNDIYSLPAIIEKAIDLKCSVVYQDPYDHNSRKILNFGHTVGHALESFFMAGNDKQVLFHGDAVASGMICEAFLSVQYAGLSPVYLTDIQELIKKYFQLHFLDNKYFDDIIGIMDQDKKNIGDNMVFSLIQMPGKGIISRDVKTEDVLKAFDFYNKVAKA
jgi:3-dehydroquinate synthase